MPEEQNPKKPKKDLLKNPYFIAALILVAFVGALKIGREQAATTGVLYPIAECNCSVKFPQKPTRVPVADSGSSYYATSGKDVFLITIGPRDGEKPVKELLDESFKSIQDINKTNVVSDHGDTIYKGRPAITYHLSNNKGNYSGIIFANIDKVILLQYGVGVNQERDEKIEQDYFDSVVLD